VLQSFLGKRTQIPTMFSALKREGKPLYKYARAGIEVERQPRNIEVFDISLIGYTNGIVEFKSRVSKGTYIRTLGEEIAVALGTLGHLVSLQRTAIGNFKIEDAIPLEDVNFDQLIPMRKALSHLPSIEVGDLVTIDIKNGRSLKLNIDDELVLLICKDQALALYEKRDDGLYYSRRGLF
ncbi:MAG: pseudouridine synthase, partial [Bacilli bacterium]